MNKKLTKTIILIVFVVFLGVTKVEAKVAKTCVYSCADKDKCGNAINKVSINDTYSDATIVSGSNAHGKVMNWGSGHKSGFSGYDYFVGNNNNCPPVLLQEKQNVLWIDSLSSDDLWFADSGTQKKVADYFDDDYWPYDLVSQEDGEGAHGDTSNNNSATVITRKQCSCTGTQNGKKFSVDIEVPDSLTSPKVKVHLADAANVEKIVNWDTPLVTYDFFFFGKNKTTYTYMSDLAKNNKCPDYALLYRGGGYFLAVSDEANFSEVKDAISEHMTGDGDVYTASCMETVIENKTSNSNKQEEPPKEYDDPEINSNVTPLSPDFDTYSCGGSYLTGIPKKMVKLTKFIYIFLQILVPIAIIILGSLDLLKAVAAQKEDEIKKGQQVFIKRLIGAAIVFFVFAIVKFIISLVSDNSTSIINCVDCFLKNNDSCVKE